MNYKNAKQGFEKILMAEWLVILSGFDGFFDGKLWWVALILITFSIVAFFINLKGLKLISLDDNGYDKAYKFAVGTIIFEIVSLIAAGFTMINNVDLANIISKTASAVADVSEFCVAYIIIKSSIEILKKLDNKSALSNAKSTLVIYEVAYIFGFVLKSATEFELGTIAQLSFVVVGIVALVLTIIAQIKYLTFLKEMTEVL